MDGEWKRERGIDEGDYAGWGTGKGMVVVEGRECVETPRRVEPVNKPYSLVT